MKPAGVILPRIQLSSRPGVMQYLTLVEDTATTGEETTIRDVLRLTDDFMACSGSSSSSASGGSDEDCLG